MSERQTILDRHRRPRVQFDPSDRDHRAELKFFMTNGKWRNGCPFFLEHPYLEIPTMCFQRITEHSLA